MKNTGYKAFLIGFVLLGSTRTVQAENPWLKGAGVTVGVVNFLWTPAAIGAVMSLLEDTDATKRINGFMYLGNYVGTYVIAFALYKAGSYSPTQNPVVPQTPPVDRNKAKLSSAPVSK
jgi:hypothetical protein